MRTFFLPIEDSPLLDPQRAIVADGEVWIGDRISIGIDNLERIAGTEQVLTRRQNTHQRTRRGILAH